LGNHAAILRALRCDGKATRRVLDIGCGHGGLLKKLRRRMGVEVLGVDLRPPEGKRQRNYRVDRGGGWDYRLRAAQAEGVSSASR
jgi:cyclopropane fatty-acyl-phospholipid synthase-like methyltransferase